MWHGLLDRSGRDRNDATPAALQHQWHHMVRYVDGAPQLVVVRLVPASFIGFFQSGADRIRRPYPVVARGRVGDRSDLGPARLARSIAGGAPLPPPVSRNLERAQVERIDEIAAGCAAAPRSAWDWP